jgi:hypothetical protein
MKTVNSIDNIVKQAVSSKSEALIDEAQQNLLRLCRLLVDIEYKKKYGAILDKKNVSDYSEATND